MRLVRSPEFNRVRWLTSADMDSPLRSSVSVAHRAWLEQLDGGLLLPTQWLDQGHIDAVLPAGIAPGVYALKLEGPRGLTTTLGDALAVDPDAGSGAGTDGGGDGGAADAGADDGAVDAGTDGGAVDAGTDGGAADAGADGGGADAGRDGGCNRVTYVDGDGDGHGVAASAAIDCSPARVSVGDDCNDADPLTHPGATEVCNGLDDNCNGLVDEGVCPLDAGWTARIDTGGASADWITAWSYGRGAVWIAGRTQVMSRTGEGAFVSTSGCPNWANGSWASADGTATIGFGSAGVGNAGFADARPDGGLCTNWQSTNNPVTGVVGFALADGGVVRFALSRRGELWQLEGGTSLQLSAPAVDQRLLSDLHGSSPSTLMAVGSGTSGGPSAFVWRDGGWSEEALPGSGMASGVWVLSESTAFAVGTKGLAVQRVDGHWLALAGLDGGTLTSVRAFGPGRIYTVDLEGRVRRWNGLSWKVLADLGSGASMSDLTGSAEDDLWAVGANGLVLHWPR